MAEKVEPQVSDERAAIRSAAPRLIILALALVGMQALFAFSYMGAFGKPHTKQAPFIVVSSTEGNAGYIANKLNAQKGSPVLATISTDKAAALDEVKRDKAVAVYEFNPSVTTKTTDNLYYGTAQGAARAQIATTVGDRVADQGQRTLEKHDIVKARPDDPRGTAPFYLVLAWMVGAYILPAAMASTVGARARSAIGARLRIALFAGYAIVSGLVGALVAMHGYDALGGSYWKIAATGAVLVFAVSTFTFGLTSLLGTLGVGLAILLFVILGNPSSGGAFNYDVLPQPWRAVGPYLPNGAGTDAVRSLSYFDGIDLARPFWVMAAWLIAGLWLIFMVGNSTYRFAPGHVDTPENTDAGVVGEHLDLMHHEAHERDDVSGSSDADAGSADISPADATQPSPERPARDAGAGSTPVED